MQLVGDDPVERAGIGLSGQRRWSLIVLRDITFISRCQLGALLRGSEEAVA
ncbi:hypothetical protein [Amycolatopsis aidingensis]|uniref:hypothetical protein n=1 Tax=Amycolatopsis aidingensis TaxID=2842453 RepID=UPI001C0E0081|nr:hypothetical protein [Amycolatopsis aidingensis]